MKHLVRWNKRLKEFEPFRLHSKTLTQNKTHKAKSKQTTQKPCKITSSPVVDAYSLTVWNSFLRVKERRLLGSRSSGQEYAMRISISITMITLLPLTCGEWGTTSMPKEKAVQAGKTLIKINPPPKRPGKEMTQPRKHLLHNHAHKITT